jgi:hypothetical protein
VKPSEQVPMTPRHIQSASLSAEGLVCAYGRIEIRGFFDVLHCHAKSGELWKTDLCF